MDNLCLGKESVETKLARLNYFQARSKNLRVEQSEYWAVARAIDLLVRTLEDVYLVDPVLNPRTNIWEI